MELYGLIEWHSMCRLEIVAIYLISNNLNYIWSVILNGVWRNKEKKGLFIIYSYWLFYTQANPHLLRYLLNYCM
jgi:hypothetical protein